MTVQFVFNSSWLPTDVEIITKQWSATCPENRQAIWLNEIWKYERSWWCIPVVNRTVGFGNIWYKMWKWQFSTLFVCSTVSQASATAIQTIPMPTVYGDCKPVYFTRILTWRYARWAVQTLEVSEAQRRLVILLHARRAAPIMQYMATSTQFNPLSQQIIIYVRAKLYVLTSSEMCFQ